MGREVAAAGGLHVIGTERHEARRVDRQLAGRAGRQGDPGSSQFYLALDDELLEGLEVRFLANRDANLSFVLLSDFKDASEQTQPTDEALLARARAGIEALNLKYAAVAAPVASAGPAAGRNGDERNAEHADGSREPFFLVHRARRWNPQEGV